MDCRLPKSSVHGVSQARIPEWIAISFSRGSSRFRDWTRVSCITGGFFTNWATREHSTNIYWVCILGLTLDAEHRVMNRSNKNPYSLKFIADSWRSSLTVIVKWNINIRGKDIVGISNRVWKGESGKASWERWARNPKCKMVSFRPKEESECLRRPTTCGKVTEQVKERNTHLWS